MDIAELRAKNFARTKQAIRESVTPDTHIMHAQNTIAELDKVANALVKRLRDWYKTYNPEAEHAHRDHKEFVQLVLENPQRADTMGADVREEELGVFMEQAALAQTLYAQREQLVTYLEALMQQETPNLVHVAGALIGAELIQLAGSLKRLAMMPASTIQLLGAETAMFRFLRKKAAPPKHGIIFNHPFLQKTQPQLHGKVARALADTISIAVRVDYFKGEFCGDALLKKVEKHG